MHTGSNGYSRQWGTGPASPFWVVNGSPHSFQIESKFSVSLAALVGWSNTPVCFDFRRRAVEWTIIWPACVIPCMRTPSFSLSLHSSANCCGSWKVPRGELPRRLEGSEVGEKWDSTLRGMGVQKQRVKAMAPRNRGMPLQSEPGCRRKGHCLRSNSRGLQRTPPPTTWTVGSQAGVRAMTLHVSWPLLNPNTSYSPMFPSVPKTSCSLLFMGSF